MGKLTANRVVLLLHGAIVVLTIVGFYIAAISHSLPKSWQATVAVIAGVVAALVGATTAAIKFLDGSQKFDALTANRTGTASSTAAVLSTQPAGSDLYKAARGLANAQTGSASNVAFSNDPPDMTVERGPDQSDGPKRTRKPVMAANES